MCGGGWQQSIHVCLAPIKYVDSESKKPFSLKTVVFSDLFTAEILLHVGLSDILSQVLE